MMSIDTRWHYLGLQTVIVENPHLRVVVMPETGGRIYSILHRPTNTEFLWQNPRTEPRIVPFGSSFDNTLAGGWDDLLPTVDACTYKGEALPDHGELWALSWAWDIVSNGNESALYTSVSGPITPVKFERWLTLDPEHAELKVRYRLSNLAAYPVELIWGLHPMLAISPGHRLDLPPTKMLVAFASSAQLGTGGQEYDWPAPSDKVDMRQIPPQESLMTAGHYATASSGNWFALTDTQRKLGLAMVYPPEIFRALWLWMCYGGWRNHYHLAVEPWSGYPVNLAEAAAAGRQTTLSAHQSIDCEVTVFAYSGLASVKQVERVNGHYAAQGE